MKHIITKRTPNPSESTYWVDLKENPYGGIIKYYDADIQEWVYIEEPIFQNSYASKLTKEHFETIEDSKDVTDTLQGIQTQIDDLDERKANIEEVLTEEQVNKIHDELNSKISANTNSISDNYTALTNKIQIGDNKNSEKVTEVNNALTAEINSLREALQKGYDDTEIKNALSTKASYAYVENAIRNITGVTPDVLDTLEELAAALGNDPNFAATVTTQISNKTDRSDVIDIVNDMLTDAGLVETDPTVPQWAKQPTKPSYTAAEVGALPASKVIPERTSQLTNDSGYLTQLEVNSLINAHKPLTVDQYAKINKIDSYQVLNVTEPDVNITTEYATVIINTTSTLDTINIRFTNNPNVGSRVRLYINPQGSVSTNFYTLKNEVLHTAKVSTITRFDITAIDLTDYPVTTETGTQILSEGGSTIIVNLLDGYIIDYVDSSSNKLTWYEGQ